MIRLPNARLLLTLALSVSPLSLRAQMPANAAAGTQSTQTSSPQDDNLAEHMRILAQNPHDLNALIGAGQAALVVGDSTAAMSFFGRANDVNPNDGRVKAGLGSTLLLLEQPQDALRLFGEAVALGIPESTIAIDRGLAYDLRGDQANAQRDYRLAMKSGQTDELLRRYALSLGISGNKDAAMHILDPLLRKQDQGAWRDRTFILAMDGDVDGANTLTHTLMPASADAMAPFLARLQGFTPSQRAMAVTYGTMPEDASPNTQIPSSVIAAAPKPNNPQPVEVATAEPQAPPRIAHHAKTPPPPPATPAPVAQSPASQTVAPPSKAFVSASPEFSLTSVLQGVKPDTPAPATEVLSKKELRDARRIAKAKAAKEAAEKAAADAQRKIERANPAREWVQVAGGNNRHGFERTWASLKDDHPALFRHRTAWYTPLNHTYRILVGPFDGPHEAKSFVNKLADAGLPGFTFSSDAGQVVTKVGSKGDDADAGATSTDCTDASDTKLSSRRHHKSKHERKKKRCETTDSSHSDDNAANSDSGKHHRKHGKKAHDDVNNDDSGSTGRHHHKHGHKSDDKKSDDQTNSDDSSNLSRHHKKHHSDSSDDKPPKETHHRHKHSKQ